MQGFVSERGPSHCHQTTQDAWRGWERSMGRQGARRMKMSTLPHHDLSKQEMIDFPNQRDRNTSKHLKPQSQIHIVALSQPRLSIHVKCMWAVLNNQLLEGTLGDIRTLGIQEENRGHFLIFSTNISPWFTCTGTLIIWSSTISRMYEVMLFRVGMWTDTLSASHTPFRRVVFIYLFVCLIISFLLILF